MKRALALLLLTLLPVSAFGQGTVRNDTPTTLYGTNLMPGKAIAVDRYGHTYTEPGNQVAVHASASVAFGSITNAFVALLTNTNKLKWCLFNNATNQPVSWDDGTNEVLSGQPASTLLVLDWGANGRWMATNIRIKYTGSAPASGTAYVNCGY